MSDELTLEAVRLARLVLQSSLYTDDPDIREVVDSILGKDSRALVPATTGPLAEIERAVVELRDHLAETAQRNGSLNDAIRIAFSYWVARAGRDPKRTVLTADRRTKIGARLRECPLGPMEALSECLYAIDGCLESEYHVQHGYTGIELIFRNREKFEGFAMRNRGYENGVIHPLVEGAT